MIMEMLNAVAEFNQAKSLPEFIPTCIPCPECFGRGLKLYDEVDTCRTCRGRMEIEVMRCSICGKDENTCACDVAAKEIAA